MLLAGIVGGIINYLLPSNTDSNGVKIRKKLVCMVLGAGATILIPLFLEIAQSKLMDNIHYGWELQKKECDCSRAKSDTITVQIFKADTAKKDSGRVAKPTTDTVTRKLGMGNTDIATNCCIPIKNYFLYAAYCLLAAAAGLRFISGLMDSVLKDKEIADKNRIINKTKEQLETEKKEAEDARIAEQEANKAKEEAEKQKEKLAAQDKKEADRDEEELHLTAPVRFMKLTEKQAITDLPAIGPATNENDRQKGRFGGKSENNGRRISATVNKRRVGIYYPFILTVESTNPLNNPLVGEVIFFLHQSFTPSVIKVIAENGKAVFSDSAYGAFTVGAVSDDGNTLLELDLAEDRSFPKEFRER